MIEVVGVLVSAGNRKHARAQDVGDAVSNKQRIARISDQSSKFAGEAYTALGGCQQHDPTIRSKPTAIKSGGNLFASDGWKAKRLDRMIVHGGCGSA